MSAIQESVECLDERDINIYTDGSSYQGPRRAGIGIRPVTVDKAGNERVEDLPRPGYDGATNQEAELAACIEALKAAGAKRGPIDASLYRRVVIWTDSTYVVNGFASARSSWPLTPGNLFVRSLRISSSTDGRAAFERASGKGSPIKSFGSSGPIHSRSSFCATATAVPQPQNGVHRCHEFVFASRPAVRLTQLQDTL
jgi:hypothetical protein